MTDYPTLTLQQVLGASHPLVLVNGAEPETLHGSLTAYAVRSERPVYEWTAHTGMSRLGTHARFIAGAQLPLSAVGFIAATPVDSVFFLQSFADALQEPAVQMALRGALSGPGSGRRVVVPYDERPIPMDLMGVSCEVSIPEQWDGAGATLASGV